MSAGLTVALTGILFLLMFIVIDTIRLRTCVKEIRDLLKNSDKSHNITDN